MNLPRPRLEPADLRAIQAQLSAPEWSAKLADLKRADDNARTGPPGPPQKRVFGTAGDAGRQRPAPVA